MHNMTKNMFRVETDQDTGRKVLQKVVDELTKNHRLDKETSLGIMPEIEGLFCFLLCLYFNRIDSEKILSYL